MSEVIFKIGDNVKLRNASTTRTYTVQSVNANAEFVICNFLNEVVEKETAKFSFDEVEVIEKKSL